MALTIRQLLMVCLYVLPLFMYAQVSVLSADVATFAVAGEGDLYIDENGTYYIGLQSGGLKEIGIVTLKGSAQDEVLSWNGTTSQWEPKAPSLGALTLTTSTIRSTNRARVLWTPNTNINASLNTALTPGSIELNEIGLTTTGHVLTNMTGNLRFIVYPNLISSGGERTNFNCNFFVNGSVVETLFTGLYARNALGHTDTGGPIIFEYEGALASDEFSFSLSRETANTDQVSLVSRSKLLIDQYTEHMVITDVSAPVDLSIAQGPQGPPGPQGIQGVPGPPISSPTDVYHATGNVMANGLPTYIQGASVSFVSTGVYRVDFTTPHANGDDYPVLFSMEQNPGADDYVPAYSNVSASGFNVEITEQDNGASPGVPQNAGFSFYVPL